MTDPTQPYPPDLPPGASGGQPWPPGASASPFTSTGAPNWPAPPPWASGAPASGPFWGTSGPTPPTGSPSTYGVPSWPAAPAGAPPTAPASHHGRRLRLVGWVLVIVSFVGGLATFGFGIYRAVGSMTHMQRVPAALGGPVTIDSPGTYPIYYEPGALAPSDETDPDVQAVGPDGMVATVTPPEGDFSYSFGDRAGHKIAELAADQPGRYQIEPRSADLPSGELAVGGDLGGWLATALVAAGIAVVVFLVGLVLLIVGYVQRRPRH